MSVEDHQRLTIERYDALVAENLPVSVMPVLQGYRPGDYHRHLLSYGDRLHPGMRVGVGSVCKRNGNPDAIAEILTLIRRARPASCRGGTTTGDDMSDPRSSRGQAKPADIGLWATVFVVVGAIVILFVVLINTARSETVQASPVHLAYCSLFARESVRIDIMHSRPIGPTVTDEYIEGLAVEVFKQCMSVLPTLLPLPEAHRNLGTWVEDMRTLLISRAGTEPAMSGDAEWREACSRTYRTWNEETGTVIRRGNPDPVRCPCGKDVVCE
jgi:hypothetical protein